MVKEKPLHPALARRGDGVCADGVFEMPTKVVFGRGVASQVGRFARELAGSRAMLVADPGVLALGIADRLAADLQDAGLTVTVFDHVQPNPRDVHCIEAADMAREASVDVLVGVGGGSSIDTAKCAAILMTNGGHPRDWEDFGALHSTPVPVIALPTTSGTGSEVSPSAIITDTVRRKKMNLFDPRICPRIALVDPDLTMSMPPALTAATGMDALREAVDYVRILNRELGIPPLRELIRREDLDVLAEKAAANTSRPSNPREAGVSDFRRMFEDALA